jgi:hypothetical protein
MESKTTRNSDYSIYRPTDCRKRVSTTGTGIYSARGKRAWFLNKKIKVRFQVLKRRIWRWQPFVIYCRVVSLKYINVSEVLTASIIHSSPWWWRQYAHLKHQSASTRLHGAMFQKDFFFKRWKPKYSRVPRGRQLAMHNCRLYYTMKRFNKDFKTAVV